MPILEPGIGSTTHKYVSYGSLYELLKLQRVLKIVLFSLLSLLFVCMVLGINQPHSTVLFLLALGLTLSYFW